MKHFNKLCVLYGVFLVLAGATAYWWVPQVEYEILSPWTMMRVIGSVVAMAVIFMVVYLYHFKRASFGDGVVLAMATSYCVVSIFKPGYWYGARADSAFFYLVLTFVSAGLTLLIQASEARLGPPKTIYLVEETD